MNTIATTSLFFFLKEFNLKLKYVVLYCISFATLCYPISGTPFHYIHAYIFSLISIFCIIIAIKNKNKFLWFSLPFIGLFAFLSMQTPTAYILIIFFFYGCSQDSKSESSEISETEDILISYELSAEEKSLKHPELEIQAYSCQCQISTK